MNIDRELLGRKLVIDEKMRLAMNAVAAKINERMKELGIERKFLARVMNISTNRLSQILKGGNMTLTTLLTIEEKLNMKLLHIDPQLNILSRKCRECGCTDDDCSQCIEKTGALCHWVEQDLCSACVNPRPSLLSTDFPGLDI